MTMQLTPAGESATQYAYSSLAAGLSLAREVAGAISTTHAEALTPGPLPAGLVLSPSTGGLGQTVIGELGEWLSERFPGCVLIVELPLWRPEDLTACRDSFSTVSVGDEVYAYCSTDSPVPQIDLVLRSADPSFQYNAMVVSGDRLSCLLKAQEGWRSQLVTSLHYVLIGAFDGEGFIALAVNDFQ